MRINKFLAQNSSLSRRKADEAVQQGRVAINGKTAELGQEVAESDQITLDSIPLKPTTYNLKPALWLMNKPVGFVCSRDGQGSKTIYDLLPPELQNLNSVGRLDKNSSGLLLLTNNGDLLNKLAHPSNNKTKVYEVSLNKPLTPDDKTQIEQGINIGDTRPSSLLLTPHFSLLTSNSYKVRITEGRNRQIRRTFEALGYQVKTLHRIKFGEFELGNLKDGNFNKLELNNKSFDNKLS